VCWQVDPKEDADCFLIPYSFPSQVREKRYHPSESKGACWARSEARKLWQGEEFTLQIDAHSRFEKGWDEALLEMQAQCASEKAVLTTYAPHYTPPDEKKR